MLRKTKKVEKVRSKKGANAGKVALAILGVGLVAGATLVIGMDRIIDEIFVDEDWPEEDWATEDWADEDITL